MSNWREERNQFLQRKQQLDKSTSEANIRSLASQINSHIASYVNTAGISPTDGEDPNYAAANQKFQRIIDYEQEYLKVIKDLTVRVKQLSVNNNMGDQLKEMGKLRNDVVKLEKELQVSKTDADTSRTRQSTIENTRQDLSWYQGVSGKLGFTKPLHVISVGILIAFGLLILFISGLLLREFFAPDITPYNYMPSDSVFDFFTDSRGYAVIAGVVFVLVFVGILAATGRLGKEIK